MRSGFSLVSFLTWCVGVDLILCNSWRQKSDRRELIITVARN